MKPELNLPFSEMKIKIINGKEYVWDSLRRQFVRLTPEEFVRQQFLSYLITDRNYPENRLANEISIALGNVQKRCDTVLYDEYLQPLMIIEYKAPSVTINQKTFDQIVRYNMTLQVPWLIVSNGLQHYCCYVNKEKREYTFEKDIPLYEKLVENRE